MKRARMIERAIRNGQTTEDLMRVAKITRRTAYAQEVCDQRRTQLIEGICNGLNQIDFEKIATRMIDGRSQTLHVNVSGGDWLYHYGISCDDNISEPISLPAKVFNPDESYCAEVDIAPVKMSDFFSTVEQSPDLEEFHKKCRAEGIHVTLQAAHMDTREAESFGFVATFSTRAIKRPARNEKSSLRLTERDMVELERITVSPDRSAWRRPNPEFHVAYG